jgi:predicted nucleic acid-binding protein
VALIVVDASIVIAVLDPGDALHPVAVPLMRSHAGDDLRLPVSAYAEVLVGPARSGRLAEAKARMARLILSIEPITQPIAERAAAIRARHPGVKLPDALVLAVGDELNAAAVLTGDSSWRRIAKRVQVVGV